MFFISMHPAGSVFLPANSFLTHGPSCFSSRKTHPYRKPRSAAPELHFQVLAVLCLSPVALPQLRWGLLGGACPSGDLSDSGRGGWVAGGIPDSRLAWRRGHTGLDPRVLCSEAPSLCPGCPSCHEACVPSATPCHWSQASRHGNPIFPASHEPWDRREYPFLVWGIALCIFVVKPFLFSI